MTALLAEVVRSGYVESRHHGSVVALRPDGSVALALGDLDRPIFPRSSHKPLQAVALLEAGWVPDRQEHLALAASSHHGEPAHVEMVRELLGDLPIATPVHPPTHVPSWLAIVRAGGDATRLTMNCSGKHAAMLRTCASRGWPTEGYLEPDHPVQQACLRTIERLAGETVRHVAVDGCGAPQPAVSLRGLATAYARLMTDGGAAAQVRDAMRAHPWFVGGTSCDATLLMQGVPGLLAKDGWEGVYAAGLPDGGVVALKIEDGAERARPPVLVAALRLLGVNAPVLDDFATLPVLGGGRRVGDVRVTGSLL